jgi:hypothetical protein
LTGACIIALGNDIAGLFTPSDTAAAALTAASKRTGKQSAMSEHAPAGNKVHHNDRRQLQFLLSG